MRDWRRGRGWRHCRSSCTCSCGRRPSTSSFPRCGCSRERQKQSKKRHADQELALLLARMAILALMALALARPRVYSEVPLGDESQPMALGLVFDTSLSMEYKDKDKTRLDEAKERAKEIIAKVPESSLVFVVDSGVPGVPIGLPPSAALKRIDELDHPGGQSAAQCRDGAGLPGGRRVRAAGARRLRLDRPGPHRVARRSARGRTRPGRQGQRGQRGEDRHVRLAVDPQEIQTSPSIRPSPRRAWRPRASRSRSAPGSAPSARTAVTRLVEFELDGIKKGEKTVEFPRAVSRKWSSRPRRGCKDGEVHVGKVKLSGTPDPFESDDERYFVFKVRPPLKVLLLSDVPYEAEFVAAALDPSRRQSPSYLVEKGLTPRFSQLQERSQVVRVRLPAQRQAGSTSRNGERSTTMFTRGAAWWSRPVTAASRRATTIRSPASSCRPSSRNSPGQPRQRPRSARSPTSRIRFFSGTARTWTACWPWCPVYRYWPVKQPDRGHAYARELFRRRPGPGRAHVQGAQDGPGLALDHAPVTPARRRRRTEGRPRTPGTSSPLGWTFLAMMDQTVPYLAGAANEELNFEAGENVLLKLKPTARFTKFLVTGPDPKTKPRLVPSPSNEFLEVIEPPDLGIWSVKATAADNRDDDDGLQRQCSPGGKPILTPSKSRTSTPSSARTTTSWPKTCRRSKRS